MKYICHLNKIQAKINRKFTEPILVESGIGQRQSLSPLLSNIVIDEVIKNMRKLKRYKMGEGEVTICCYADDAVTIATDEVGLQRLVQRIIK